MTARNQGKRAYPWITWKAYIFFFYRTKLNRMRKTQKIGYIRTSLCFLFNGPIENPTFMLWNLRPLLLVYVSGLSKTKIVVIIANSSTIPKIGLTIHFPENHNTSTCHPLSRSVKTPGAFRNTVVSLNDFFFTLVFWKYTFGRL